MNTVSQPMYEWKELPWKEIEKQTFKLQKRIYQATKKKDVSAVHKLQRLLVNSWYARCLAVRRVTQDNQGKKTAGVDGKKLLNPKQRMALVQELKEMIKPQPVRRIWIPKPGKDEKRPLGIPTIKDRAHQALIKMALEPEWEAKFEPNSYGFRPGRSCHDAVEAIFTVLKHKVRFVLDADIKGCFDNIDHQALLRKLNTIPKFRRIIKKWLKAGVMENLELTKTEKGTPQGGVISPLLSNVALHGLEEKVKASFPKRDSRGRSINPHVVRYADDFVILHQDLEVIEKCKEIVSKYLKEVGLELKESKTKITHTSEKYNGNVGFDFLGFHFRQHKVGKNYAHYVGRKCQGKLFYKTVVTPSKQAVERHYRKIADVINAHNSQKQSYLIKHLNPIIRGWCNYYSSVISTNTFNKLDHLMVKRLLRWGYRRHPKKGRKWVVESYFNPIQNKGSKRPWDFISSEGNALLRHADTNIQRHVLVNTGRSPYDGDFIYWATRMGRHPEMSTRVANLLKRQKGKCLRCDLCFKYGDLLEVDHIIRKEMGGLDIYNNLQLLHKHCHDAKTSLDKWYL